MNDVNKAAAKPGLLAKFLGGALRDVFGSYKKDFVELMRKEFAAQLVLQKQEWAEQRQQIEELVRQQVQRAVERVGEVESGQYRNVLYAAQRLALLESAEFMKRNMIKAATFQHPQATLEHALSLAPQGGLALEFGVYSGSTLKVIAATRQGRDVYGFDSFEGLPEVWRSGFPIGAFAVNEPPKVEGAELVVGWFEDTLPAFLASHEGPVDFLHVDCDLYSSSKTVLDLVGPRLRPGTIVVFDEFFNYPGWQEHECKAWEEYLQRTGTRSSYEAYTLNNEQVVARIIEV